MGEVLIEGRRLDIKEGLDFSFNYSIADVRDPNKRSTEYTKTILCPSTPSNDELFGNIWDVNINNPYDSADLNVEVNFNPNKKAEARVTADGVGIMTGVVQLRRVTVVSGKMDYEVVFIGNLINIFSKIGDKNLNGFEVVNGIREYYIDFSDLNHTLNYDNISDSWDYNEDYVYPMVDCGESTLADQYGRRIWTPTDFRPWFKLKTVVDRIFDFAGFTYTSTFFDSALFDKLITSEIKETLMSDAEIAQRNTKASIGTTYDILDAANLTTAPDGDTSIFKLDTVVYDVGANWQTATFLYLAQNELIATINASIEYTITRDRQSYYSFTDVSGVVYRYDILANGNCDVYNHDTSTLLNSNQSTAQSLSGLTGDGNAVIGVPPSGNSDLQDIIDACLTDESLRDTLIDSANVELFTGWDLFYGGRQPAFNHKIKANNTVLGGTTAASVPFNFTTQVDIGDSTTINSFATVEEQQIYATDQFWSEVYIPYSVVDGVSSVVQDILWDELKNEYTVEPSGTMEVLADNNGLIEWQTMDMNAVTPDVKMSELLLSVFKMFNLYVTVDPLDETNLLIETRDTFYAGGTTRDWNKKLARDKRVTVEPLGLLTAREYIYTYSEDEDHYNDNYQSNFGYTYGRRRLEVDNDFLNNTRDIEVVFSPTPLVNDNPSNRLIPKIYDADISEGAKPTEANIRVLYYGGKLTSNPLWKIQHLPAPPFNVLGGLITTTLSTYPYAGHLDNPLAPSLDLNFGIPQELFYTANAFTGTLQYTNANLFNVYHRAYLDEITDKDSKVFTGEFYLTAWDISKLDFRDQIIVDNSYWRINKVNDYNPFKEGLTKVELIKVLDVVEQPNEVFNIGGQGSSGSGGQIEKHPRTGTKKRLNGNMSNPPNGSVKGRNNRISPSVQAFNVIGDRNFVGDGAKNITILGNNNYVHAGMENVVIINTDGYEAYESNITIIDGAKQWVEKAKTSAYTAQDREFILADATAGAFQITLPTLADNLWVNVKKTDSSANIVTVTPGISGFIDGAATLQILSQYDAVDFYCDGSNWHIR